MASGPRVNTDFRPPDNSVASSGLRSALADRLGLARYELWFGEGVELGFDGDALRIEVPSPFFRDWIQSHFASTVIEVAEALAGHPLTLKFDIVSEGQPDLGDVVHRTPGRNRTSTPLAIPGGAPMPPPTPAPPAFRPQTPRAPASQTTVTGTEQRRILRSLEDFVPGTGNRLALAASREMVETRGYAFNPLLIHGGVGLGKTHLLEGIAHGLRKRFPGINVIQITAEAFTNAFLEAMRANAQSSFRSRFRGVEALIVDDVHFLASKRATQDEFLHTYNALLSAGRPVVLSSDQHPRALTKLSDELATRFLGGMLVKVESPDAATRRAIVLSKAAARGIEMPEPVATYIADHLRHSVRELEGAVHSVMAHASLIGRRIDLNLARLALGDSIRSTTQAIALKDIEQAVCKLFRIDADLLRSNSRSRSVAQPRMLAMYLARQYSTAAYSEIGRHFGGRNHSTVISAEKKVKAWLKSDQQSAALPGFETMADIISALERSLGA